LKKIVIVCLVILLYQKWGAITDYLNPPPDYSAAHGGQVVLYATAWCGYCKKTRALLDGKNIPFHEYDIEKSQEGADQYRRLGGQGVPVLLINGEVIHGYNPARILELTGNL
jgi:glutaredoxin